MAMASFDGLDTASIASIDGLAIGSIASIDGLEADPASNILVDLVAHYKLESDITDEEGTYTGSSSGVTFGAAQVNNGAIFDASSEYISLGNSLISYIQEFSVSFWVYHDGDPTHDEDILNRGDTGHNGLADILFWRDYAGTRHYSLIVNESSSMTSAYVPASSGWIHVVITWSGSSNDNRVRLYFNGTEDTSSPWNASSVTSGDLDDPLIVGAEADLSGAKSLEGKLDEMLFYERVLTGPEVSYLYTTGLAGNSIQ